MLSGREYDILDIISKSEKSLIASDVVKKGNELNMDLTINTVQAVLKKLLRRKIIMVDQIVYSGTVLSRSYKVSEEASDIIADMFVELYGKYEHLTNKEIIIEKLNNI